MMAATTTDEKGKTSELSTADLDYFVQLVNQHIGVQLEGKGYLIESRLQPLARDFSESSVGSLISRMRRGDAAVVDAAVEAMTTNETSFFRDQHPFATLVEEVVPELRRQSGGGLTIWNGACSSGQESYTLAITLQENFPDITTTKRVRILSTDVSPAMVERCKKGEYSRFEVNRGLPTDQAIKYFDQAGRNWVARRELREMIEARELNLLEPWRGLPKCDLVLLRNVLIYFTPSVKRDIMRRIRTEVLAPHGCLLLGASETTVGLDDGYEPRRLGNSTFNFVKASA